MIRPALNPSRHPERIPWLVAFRRQMGYFLIVALVGAYPFPAQSTMPPRLASPAAVASEASEQNPRPQPPRFAPPPLRFVPRPKIVLKPGQKCAIPLTNVLRRDWGHDRIAFPPRRGSPQFQSRDLIPPPGPSCDDVK